MASRRIYITLNDEKEKDRIIESYLSQSYSEADAIKEALYRLATNSTLSMQSKPKRNTKGNKAAYGDNKNKKVTKSDKQILKDIKDSAKVQPSTINDNSETKITNNHYEVEKEDILINLDDIDDVVSKTRQDNTTLRQNELEELKKFM